jgi:preprotein translocase subunit SecG
MNPKLLFAGLLTSLCLNVNAQNVVESFYDNNQATVIMAGVFLLACLACYIIARVKSKRGQMVLTANGWDKALLLVSPACLFASWFWGFDHEPNDIQAVLFIVAGACFVGTVIFSIAFNKGNFVNILLSIFAKVFIVFLTLLILLLVLIILVISIVIALMTKSKDDDRYILLKYDKYLDAYVGYSY